MSTTLYAANAAFANETIVVSSTEELNSAIAQLSQTTGGTVLVDGAAGPYHIDANDLGLDGKAVLITPLDDAQQPHVHQVDIKDSSNITVNGMRIDSDGFADRNSWDHDINIYDSSSIEIVNNDLSGDATGYISESNDVERGVSAMMLNNSQNISISHNTVANYSHGITYLEVKGLNIDHNDISNIQLDGIRGGGIQDAKISNNHLHDFYGSSQTINHSDMIQIWGRGTELTNKNIEISDNFLNAGDGAATQGIWVRQETFDQDGIYAENISIHGNVIYNGQPQGIGANSVKNVAIYNNTVLWDQAALTQSSDSSDFTSTIPRIILENTPGADIYGNIAAMDASLADQNFVLDYNDVASDHHPTQHFANYSGQGDLSLQDLMLRPDSPLFGEFGAETSSDLETHIANLYMENDGSDAIQSILTQDTFIGRDDSISLSAKHTLINGSEIGVNSAKVIWHFEDGTTSEGIDIVHSFSDPGVHEVTMEVLTSEGETATLTRQFTIDGSDKFSIDFNAGGIDLTQYASEITIQDDDNAQFIDGRSGKAFELDGNSRFQIDQSNQQLAGLQNFKLDLGFKMEPGSSDGHLLQMYKVMTLNVTEQGALEFNLQTSDGSYDLKTEDGTVTSENWADITIEYNGFEGALNLSVDGDILGSAEATGHTRTDPTHPLQLGSHWAESVLGAVDTFTMTTPDTEIETALADQSEQIISTDAPILAFDIQTKIPRAPSSEDEANTSDYLAMLDDIATPSEPSQSEVTASTLDNEFDAALTVEVDNGDTEEDDDTFIENLFSFILEVFGLGSDDAPDAPLDLAPYAQHAEPEAFTSPMALFDMVPTTGLLDDTTDTGGIEGEEDDDPTYGTEWLLNF